MSSSTLVYEEHNTHANQILLWLSIISIACSAITIVLMYRLEVYKNNLMNVICTMTLLQFVYDFALIPFCGKPEWDSHFDTCRRAQIGFGLFTGVASASCTNVISALVCYVIYYRKRSYLSRTFIYAVILVPSAVIGILGWVYWHKDEEIAKTSAAGGTTPKSDDFIITLAVYDYWRLVQLLLNLFFGIIIFYVLWSIDIVCSKRTTTVAVRDETGSQGSSRSAASSISPSVAEASRAYPMFLLAMRLIWYPIAQSITRFGASWFQIQYNATITDYINLVSNSSSPGLVTVQLYTYAITVPSAGTAYFAIFLFVQKGAWREFCKPFVFLRNVITGSEDSVAKKAAAAALATKHDTSCKGVKAMFENDARSERSMHSGQDSQRGGDDASVSSMDTDSVIDEGDDVYRSSRESSLYDIPSSRNVSFSSYQFNDGYDVDGPPENLDYSMNEDDVSSTSSNIQQRLSSQNARKIASVGLSAQDELDRSAAKRLNNLRRRSSAKQHGAAVTNVSAIIDYDGSIENEVFDQLDEDELFDLIVEQDVQEVQRRTSSRWSQQQQQQQLGLSSSSSSSSGRDLEGAVIRTPLPVPGSAVTIEIGQSRTSTIVEGNEAAGSASVPKSGFMDRELGPGFANTDTVEVGLSIDNK